MASAIIAGTAIYTLDDLDMESVRVETKYGETALLRGTRAGEEVYFLPRHGADHAIPPHKVNYRANLKALQSVGVTAVLGAYAVGSINPDIPPLSVVLLDDFIDFTSGRRSTFFDGGEAGVTHVDMSIPFDPELRGMMLKRAEVLDLELRDSGVYVAVNGPRLETPAEIRAFRNLGGDVVGMTAVPECVLAKELGLDFAAAAFSVNWAAGIEEEIKIVESGLDTLTGKIMTLFLDTLQEYSASQS